MCEFGNEQNKIKSVTDSLISDNFMYTANMDKVRLHLIRETEKQGLRSSDLAELNKWSLSKTSKITAGRQRLTVEDVRIWSRSLGYTPDPFVNDNVDIALAMDADGVHVGQSDMEALDVRRKLGPDKIIGVSAQTVEQALLAEKHGADYLGVGAVFPTGSKDDADDVSYDTLKAICRAVSIPVVAIGGISRDNVHRLSGSGICGVAVISAIYGAADIRRASEDLKAATREMLQA